MTQPENSVPSAPGWYECHWKGHADPKKRGVLYWNGEFLFVTSDETQQRSSQEFTDFIPLVPASEPGEREREIAEERH